MTHPETPEVGGEPAPAAPEDYFEELAGEISQEEEVEQEGGEDPAPIEDELDAEEEADDLPPIDAPVSWDAEAKAKFAELPRDTQEYIAKRESERERFVQQKSQEAARAKQESERAALQQFAAYEAQVAQQLQQYAQAFQPQRPDPTLLVTDPTQYALQQRAYDDALAQQQQLQQEAAEFARNAQMREHYAEQAYMAEQHELIVQNFPEYADPTTGPKLQAELTAVAKELGYPDELIAQARASDILAMRKAAEWKAKAARYDALNARKMEKVRAARGLPKVATPGAAQDKSQLRATRAEAAFEKAKTSRNINDRGAAFYDFLENSGRL